MDGEWDKESALSGAEGLVAENDLFRRVIGMQNADLTHAEERIAGLEGELAQAKRHVDALWHTGGENMRELGAENQRLREALERCIAAWDTLDEGFSHTAIEAARAALTPTEEPATCPTCGKIGRAYV